MAPTIQDRPAVTPQRSTPTNNRPVNNRPAAPARFESTQRTSDSVQLSPQASALTQNRQAAPPDRNNPAAIEPNGDVDYYQRRHDDFVRRNPGVEPPDYYLNYGDKYAHRFTEELRPNLSARGQQWLDDARGNLQERIEARRAEDPAAFAELERDNEAFRRFAYDTHPGAYTDAGLANLPPRDLLQIPVTPDRRDLLSPDGIRQIGQTGAIVAGQWAQQGAEALANTAPGRAVVDTVQAAANTEVGRTVVNGVQTGLGHVRDGAEWAANTQVGQAVRNGASWAGERTLEGLSIGANAAVDGYQYVANTQVGQAVGEGARWVADSAPGRAVGGALNAGWDWLNRQWE